MDKNVVQVQIFGHSYTIRGEAEQGYIVDAAAYVDRKMREVTEKLPVASLSKVAVLASLNIADELFKERRERERRARDAAAAARSEQLTRREEPWGQDVGALGAEHLTEEELIAHATGTH